VISYAQNFEDVMLARLFAGQERGFYVDVGAWDPHLLSTTKHFYLRGWHGINIEPIESRWRLFRDARPHDANLNVAIAAAPGEITFWLCRDDDALSTADRSTADAHRAQGRSVSETRVPTRRLDEIFAEHAPADIDFLKIDVEGLEAEVIGTMSFERWRPRVLIIEATLPAIRPDWSNPEAVGTWHGWEPDLIGRGYVFAHFDGLNRFYVRREEQRLAARLRLPPGVFDEIEETGMNAGRSADLLARLTRTEAESAARLERVTHAEAESAARLERLARSEAESAARLERVTHAEDESAARLERLTHAEALIEQLNNRLLVLDHEVRQLDRPWKALSHLGHRLGAAVTALGSNPSRRKP
jgi:FkbM family methyltransferase